VERFPDNELKVRLEASARGHDVYLVQPTSPPVADHLLELLLLADACRRAGAARITGVVPYFGYARQDRKDQPRVSITAKLVANLITEAGADRVITMDLHAPQIQGFFDIPCDNIYGSPVLMGELWRKRLPSPIVVSPDVGGVVRARAMAKLLETGLAIIDKRRPKANEAKVMHIIGEGEGRSCVLVDDLVDTAGTLCKAAKALKEHGAARVVAFCTHAVLSGPAVKNIAGSQLDELVVSNTIPFTPEARECEEIRSLSIAGLLAESMRRISNEESVSSLFMD